MLFRIYGYASSSCVNRIVGSIRVKSLNYISIKGPASPSANPFGCSQWNQQKFSNTNSQFIIILLIFFK